jgi:hypothetical protein
MADYPKDSLSYVLFELAEPDRTEALENMVYEGRTFTLKAAGSEPVRFWLGSRLLEVPPEGRPMAVQAAARALLDWGERGQCVTNDDRAAGRYVVEVFEAGRRSRRAALPTTAEE